MDIRIRDARLEDAPFLAWVTLAAGRSHVERSVWDLMIGDSEDKCLAFLERLAIVPAKSFCHYSAFLVAEVDGHSGAALCGYDPVQAGTPTLIEAVAKVANQLGWDEAQSNAAATRAAPFLTCAPEEPEGTWIIENVATLPELRAHGLARALLEEILNRGRRKGYRQAQIGVFIGNTPARRAYEAVGFRAVDEKRHPNFDAAIGCPGIARLLRDL